MGAVLNTLPVNEIDALGAISPNRADWLTSHADATGLAVVEVERLWNRFRQITGSNDQTKLYPNNGYPSELSYDVFVKNYARHLPRSKADPDTIPFGNFLLVMQWLEAASIDQKLAGVFLYLNNGEPITINMISKLLKYIYPETKEDEIKALSVEFMQQLGTNEHGQVNQQQFIAGVKRAIPPAELEELLHFDIIPSQLLEETNRLPSLQSSTTNLHNTTTDPYTDDLISDDQLRRLANQAARKNWTKLALTLGFLEYDIESYKVQNNNDPTDTVYELLRTWREQEASLATKNRLKNCLRQSGMEELVSILN